MPLISYHPSFSLAYCRWCSQAVWWTFKNLEHLDYLQKGLQCLQCGWWYDFRECESYPWWFLGLFPCLFSSYLWQIYYLWWFRWVFLVSFRFFLLFVSNHNLCALEFHSFHFSNFQFCWKGPSLVRLIVTAIRSTDWIFWFWFAALIRLLCSDHKTSCLLPFTSFRIE